MKDKVNRERTVFENQKADIGRLLGEAMKESDNIFRADMNPFDALLNLKQSITDALAELDNMEEGEARLPKNYLEQAKAMGGDLWCFTCENRHKFDLQLFSCRHCDCNPLTQPQVSAYKRDEGKDAEPPAEDVGGQLSDAMGGAEERFEQAMAEEEGDEYPREPLAEMPDPLERYIGTAEEPEKPCQHEYFSHEGKRICSYCGEPEKEGECQHLWSLSDPNLCIKCRYRKPGRDQEGK